MKILFDPVYTQRPDVCSTSYLVWELIDQLCAWRPDVFFYVCYPPHKMDEQAKAFMSKHPDRVTLIPLEQSTSDRVSELYMLRNDFRLLLNPWSEKTWDIDVVVSSRIPVLKHMRVHSSRFMGHTMPSQRLYVGLEEMPVLPFRQTVPWSETLYPDQIMSYGLADAVLVCHQWLIKSLKPVLRDVLSPAWQKRVLSKIHEVLPVKLGRLVPKTEMYAQGDFNVTFVGRVTGTRNFGDAAELFRKQFSYPLGPGKQSMKFLISTNSESIGAGKYGEIDFVDMQMNNREEFYQFLKTAHVAISLTTVEDFSMTTYETLRAGVPIIMYDYPWNEFLGPDYPFRVNTEIEAYAMVNAFAADYAKQYARFVQWEATYWKSYVEGSMNVTASECLIGLLEDFEQRRNEHLHGKGGSFVEQLQSIAPVDGLLNLTQYIKDHGTSHMVESVPEHFSLPLGRVPSTLILKLMAQLQGWRDTNVTGVMSK